MAGLQSAALALPALRALLWLARALRWLDPQERLQRLRRLERSKGHTLVIVH